MSIEGSARKYIGFPRQRVSISKKGKAFTKQCVDSAIDMTIYNNEESLRMSRYEKEICYDLMDGIIHRDVMYKITNPFGIKGFDREIQSYPLLRPRINLLGGEEANRRFDFSCRVVNQDAISEKEKQIKEEYITRLSDIVFTEKYDEGTTKIKLAELDRWKSYEAQDFRERMATQILQYLWKYLKLDIHFNKGMMDALIAGEEIYCSDILSGEPIFRKVNPKNLYTIRSNDSPFIDDADIIVEEGFHSIGYVIDNYYDYLTERDIDALEAGMNGGDVPGRAEYVNYSESDPISITNAWIDTEIAENINRVTVNTDPFDGEGRIRVVRVVWRSLRKILEISYYDEDGRLVKDFKDEFYEPDESLGEKVKVLWVSEWWEGTKIGKDIYVKMGPRPIQFRRFANRSASGSGYVGTIYNTGTNKTQSLVSMLAPYEYLYNEFMDRIKSAFSKFKGPMIELDFAKMPADWTPELWMHYAENMGYLIVDSFKEGAKGAATGKLAGGFNTTGKVLNPDLGNYIQQHILMLQYIEKQMGIISGIPDQRLGEIENRETVGGVERAVMQSSHITESIFKLHDNTKKRALEVLLETAKYAWRGNKKKLQYVLDDVSSIVLDVDGEIFNEAEYGLFITDGSSETELRQVMKTLAQAGLQNDKISFSALLDIYTSSDLASMRRKIEMYEKESIERAQQQIESQNEVKRQEIQAMSQLAQEELAQKERDSIRKAETQLTIKSMELGESDESPEEQAFRLRLDLEKQQLEERKFNFDKQLEREKLNETKRSNLAKESIARTKSTQTKTSK
jgi:hypothetical protein